MRVQFRDAPADANTGRTLVQTFPPGTYYLMTATGGRVSLYRVEDPSMNLGNVGEDAREGRATHDRIMTINQRNAAFWAGKMGGKSRAPRAAP